MGSHGDVGISVGTEGGQSCEHPAGHKQPLPALRSPMGPAVGHVWCAEETEHPTLAHACCQAHLAQAPQGKGLSLRRLRACQAVKASLPVLCPGQRLLLHTSAPMTLLSVPLCL